MRKSKKYNWIIRTWVIIIFFCVSIQAEEKLEIVIQKGHSYCINSVAVSRDEKFLVSGSSDHNVHLWDIKHGKEIRTFVGHKYSVTSVALSEDGQTLVSGSWDDTVRLWDTRTGKVIGIYEGHKRSVTSVVLSKDGKILASGSDDNTVRLWDAKTCKEIHILRGHTDAVTSVALSVDGQTLVSGSGDKTVRLWNVTTGREIHVFVGHSSSVTSVALSGDSQILASGSSDNTVRLWDVSSGKEIRFFAGHTDWVSSVALSVDGQTLVSGSSDKTVRLWDTRTGKEIRTFTGHIGVTSVCFSTDSTYIISGNADAQIKIWDLQKGYLLATLIAFKNNSWVAYTPDNYYICSSGSEKYINFKVENTLYEAQKYSVRYNNADVVANRLQRTYTQLMDIERLISEDKQTRDMRTAPSVESKTTNIPIPNSLPVVVINYFKCKGNVIEEEKPVVDSPEVEISATVKDNDTDLQKIIISINGTICNEIPISTKSHKLKQSLTLRDSTNHIKIIATNSMGFQGIEEKVITFQKPFSKASPLQQMVKTTFGKKRSWAVLIGIKDYSLQKNGMESLPYALNDVQAMKEYLKNGLDFDIENIITLVDAQATKQEILRVLGDNIPQKVSPEDRLLVYFSVHGGKEIKKTEEGEKTYSYLIPHDGKKELLYSTGISMDVLSQLAERIEAKQVLFVVDACFSGNIGQIISKEGVYAVETQKEIETFIKNKGRDVMTAGTINEKAVMGQKWNNHSVYTYYLLKGLKGAADYNQNRVISLTELYLYLKTYVPKEAGLTPQRITLDSSKGGEFVFYREGED